VRTVWRGGRRRLRRRGAYAGGGRAPTTSWPTSRAALPGRATAQPRLGEWLPHREAEHAGYGDKDWHRVTLPWQRSMLSTYTCSSMWGSKLGTGCYFVECGDGWLVEEAWRRLGKGSVWGLSTSRQLVELAVRLRAVPGRAMISAPLSA